MAGRRMISEKVCDSEKLSKVSAGAERLWFRLLTKTDDKGNFHAKPALVRGNCLPQFDNVTLQEVAGWLEELANVRSGESSDDFGLIAFYENRGEKFLHFIGFELHQKLRKDRALTIKFPGHPANLEIEQQIGPPDDEDFEEIAGPPMPARKQPAENQMETSGKPSVNPVLLLAGGSRSEVKTSQEKIRQGNTPGSVGESVGGNQERKTTKVNTGDWKSLAIMHRRLLGGRKAPVDFKPKFLEFCAKYGDQVVLTCFEDWAAGSASWVERENVTRALAAFFKKLPDMAAEEMEISQAISDEDKAIHEQAFKEEQERQRNAGAVEASIARQNAEHAERFAHETPEHKRMRELEAAGIGTAENYFAEVERV